MVPPINVARELSWGNNLMHLPEEVQAAFAKMPKKQRESLLVLRQLIFVTAKETPAVGSLLETLKWGQPAYLTEQTKSGSTIRLGLFGEDQVAIFFHCGTTLVEGFREVFGDILAFSKNRAIVLSPDHPLPEDHLRYCIHTALTYHISKRCFKRQSSPIG